ncbi:RcnB family protein [Limibaculum sp. M0105]|uniref:RcnB family protein n=1 Tax=Thermohalobaculum xanthum TaxID=2753746 RepID=A0A8J7SD39_9RHOB|nr:RcnB family protein [Thermohalobaculum xanthum]MBK0398596.1 RcnB family protein [Thermohalobaculum xanthum]
MRPITAGIAASAISLLIANAAFAGIIGLRPGGVGGLGPSAPHSIAPKPHDGPRRGKPRPPWRPDHRPRPPHRYRPHGLFFPFFVERDRSEPETVYVPVPFPEPPPPEVTPPEPLDPRGSIRRLPARGASAPDATPAVGAAIAPGVPLVILDWRLHDLPEPPAGEQWVRLRREVLRIDATTRVVRAYAPDDSATAEAGADDPPSEN